MKRVTTIIFCVLLNFILIACSSSMSHTSTLVRTNGIITGQINEYISVHLVDDYELKAEYSSVKTEIYKVSSLVENVKEVLSLKSMDFQQTDGLKEIYADGSVFSYDNQSLAYFTPYSYEVISLIETVPLPNTIRFDHSNISEEKERELEFMSRVELEEIIQNLSSDIGINSLILTEIYALSHDLLMKLEDELHGQDSNYIKRNWIEEDDIFYISIRQKIDDIPLFRDLLGFDDLAGVTAPPLFEIYYSKRGIECIMMSLPVEINEKQESHVVIPIETALQSLSASFNEVILNTTFTVKDAELCYYPTSILSFDIREMHPCWIFTLEQQESGMLTFVVIDGFTGKQIY